LVGLSRIGCRNATSYASHLEAVKRAMPIVAGTFCRKRPLIFSHGFTRMEKKARLCANALSFQSVFIRGHFNLLSRMARRAVPATEGATTSPLRAAFGRLNIHPLLEYDELPAAVSFLSSHPEPAKVGSLEFE
jgi:hypothetical protein